MRGRKKPDFASYTTKIEKNKEEQKGVTGLMSGFPEEITVYILKRLPIKSVLKFRCVCKKWYDILNDPEFLKKQQNHDLGDDDSTLILRKGLDYYSISNDKFTSISSSSSSDVAITLSGKDVKALDFPIISPKTLIRSFIEETVQILGSCKGLICFVLCLARFRGLLNPFTGEYRKLPSPKSSIPSGKSLFCNYGLGYDIKINDYKLVRIAKSEENVPEVKVYTVGSNSWKSIENLDFPYVSCRGTSKFLNGSLHWIANHSFQTPPVIVSFDLGNETFKELALPENLGGGSNVCFSAAGGCLAILCSAPCPWGQFDVWVMKDYGRRESWTRFFTITENIKSFEYIIISFRQLRQMVCLKNGEFLLEFGLEAESRADLVVYEPKTERTRVLNVPKKIGYTKPRLRDV